MKIGDIKQCFCGGNIKHLTNQRYTCSECYINLLIQTGIEDTITYIGYIIGQNLHRVYAENDEIIFSDADMTYVCESFEIGYERISSSIKYYCLK